MNENASPFDRHRLEDLAVRALDGRLSEPERLELDRWVGSSSDARKVLSEVVEIESGLRWMHGPRSQGEVEPVAVAAPPQEMSLMVVGLAVAAGLAGVAWLGLSASEAFRGERAVAVQSDTAEIVGNLTALSADGRWSADADADASWDGAPRGELHRGATLRLERGAAELRLRSGVVAQLEAPVVLQMVSLDCARMLKGRMTVDVPKGAEGFRVETSAAEVIDLGTTFRVDVTDAGDTDVVVFQGKVDVRPSEHEGVKDEKQRLLTGEALRVAGDGTLSRIVNVRRDLLNGDSPKVVIAEVRDNIVRDETRKYYEIVSRGMREDARAFVDRKHEWNGLQEQGMPSYLLGGDYVKTFNDDKVTEHLRITVSLSQFAEVYLLVDDRVQRPQWLTNDFEDTGDDVGVDEAPRAEGDERSLGQGPANSIDQTHSVWRRKSQSDKPFTIGPPGVSMDNAQVGVKSRLNMFGIVAVPTTKN